MSESTLPCTNSECPEKASRVMAWSMLSGRSMFIAPYCDNHAAEVETEQGGVPASGPALSDAAAKIEGIR